VGETLQHGKKALDACLFVAGIARRERGGERLRPPARGGRGSSTACGKKRKKVIYGEQEGHARQEKEPDVTFARGNESVGKSLRPLS